MGPSAGHVRAASPSVGTVAGHGKHDFSCAYEVAVAPADDRSSEQWARVVWEEAPAPLRLFMVAGWRLVLGFHLGPRNSPGHVLGWEIAGRGPDYTACRLHSGLMTATNVFQTVDGRFVWSTFVSYDRPVARVIWLPVSLLHRLIVRVAMRLAANR